MTRDAAIVVSFISGVVIAVGTIVLMVNLDKFVRTDIEHYVAALGLGIVLIGVIEGMIVGRQAGHVRRGTIGGIIGAILGTMVAVGVVVLFALVEPDLGRAFHGPPAVLFLGPLAGIAGATVGAIVCAVAAVRKSRNSPGA